MSGQLRVRRIAVRQDQTVVVAAALLSLAVAGSQALAQSSEENSWIRFGSQSANHNSGSYNRSFVREWEANPPRGYPTISKANIAPTRAAIKRYSKIVKKGGWKKLPKMPRKAKLEVGLTDPKVAILHDRLLASGDLRSASSYPSYFDYTLDKAVKRFQASNGLTPTGVVDDRTRRALNVPAKVRLRQLRVNLNRLRAHARSSKGRYIVVNIPAAQVEAVEGDRVVSRHTGVVGKIDRRTPILQSRVHELNFNPVWRLPPTVIQKDLIPKGRQMQRAKKNVLLKYGIDAYGTNGRKLDPKKINWRSSQPFNLSYRQQPGPENPLGFVKINFHNSYSVYLHDTPSDRIFGRNFRAASSGCVRVSNIETLVTWLLKRNKGWNRYAVDNIKQSGDTKTVRLKRSVPLHMVYVTAWATEDGVVQFRRDLYRRDGVGAIAAAY
ncbi:MAG: L,D-transpeptidase family protein [Hyphomicrobiaceae bacterium]